MLQLDNVWSWKELRLELIELMELSTLQNQARDSKHCNCQRGKDNKGQKLLEEWSIFENK